MQGFNMGRYIPPDEEGHPTNGNKLHAKKHPLGARARHLQTKGALIVRFEMPFAIWCTTCKPHETIIGQGVRFNAEKKKVGNYYSTPVYSFRMKHTACGGWIEIRTDPKHTAYVVTEGARKRDTGEGGDAQQPPAVVAGLGEVAIRLGGKQADGEGEDPLARLEGKVVDKRRAETESSRILELQERQARDWDDPYEKSRRLRRTFRVERKGLERAEENREALKDKMSLGINLVDENEEDRARAGFVDFGADHVDGESLDDAAARATRLRPLFKSRGSSESARKDDTKGKKHTSRSKTKTANLVAERKAAFRHELTGNTRAAVDPFLNSTDESTWQPEVKRRRVTKPLSAGQKDGGDEKTLEHGPVAESQPPMEAPGKSPASTALVDYGSDSA